MSINIGDNNKVVGNISFGSYDNTKIGILSRMNAEGKNRYKVAIHLKDKSVIEKVVYGTLDEISEYLKETFLILDDRIIRTEDISCILKMEDIQK